MYFREYDPEYLESLTKDVIRRLPEAEGISGRKSKPNVIKELLARFVDAPRFAGDLQNPNARPTVMLETDEGDRMKLEFHDGTFMIPRAPEFEWIYDRLWALGYRLVVEEPEEEVKPPFLSEADETVPEEDPEEDPDEAPPEE